MPEDGKIQKQINPVILLPKRTSFTDPKSDVLFQKLRELRLSIAKEQNVPPYVIFHDSTLIDMIIAMPKNLSEMGQISGVGQSKLERYGKAFLKIIQKAKSI